MSTTAHFRVDPRLTQVLGENYSSSEKALKELIDKTILMQAPEDLEKIPLPLEVTDATPPDAHGTTITGSGFHPSSFIPHPFPPLSPIQPDKLKELLALDYGREPDFAIFVNGERVFHHDIQGEKFEQTITLPNGHTATVSYTIADKPLPGKKSGLIVRVGGKSIGKPHLFGLENHDDFSDKLRRRIVGEINLPPDAHELTAAGGDVIESDKGLEMLMQQIPEELKGNLEVTHTNEFNLAKARLSKQMKQRLASVPEFRRSIAEERITRLMQRSFQEGEKLERIKTLADLVLDALEIDEYIGPDAKDRPDLFLDLFLAGNVFKKHLLIEFKKPTLTVGRDAESQAKKYADTLTGQLGLSLDILIIGGEVDAKLVAEYTGQRTTFVSYCAVIALAKTQLEWLINELSTSK